jgi:2-keto-4-pentenoate hydratase
MDRAHIEEAAALLVAARRTKTRREALPQACRPRNVQEGFAIQDEVARRLGDPVGGYKGAPPSRPDPARKADESDATAPWSHAEGVRALIFRSTIHASPCVFPASAAPQCGIESEIAFRFREDLPPRATPYTREEIAAVVDAHPAIEIVSSRYAVPTERTFLDKVADCVSNSGFVYGPKCTDWRKLRLNELWVRLAVNGETVVDRVGGHPLGDPFAIVDAIVEMMRPPVGLKAGQFITCGSHTGLPYFKPGDVFDVSFEGLGDVRVTLSQ